MQALPYRDQEGQNRGQIWPRPQKNQGPLKIPMDCRLVGYASVILTVIKGGRVGGKSGLVLKGLRGPVISTRAPVINCSCITRFPIFCVQFSE